MILLSHEIRKNPLMEWKILFNIITQISEELGRQIKINTLYYIFYNHISLLYKNSKFIILLKKFILALVLIKEYLSFMNHKYLITLKKYIIFNPKYFIL